MVIGSNNSLTYLKPNGFWSKLVNRFIRCQEVSYKDQYKFYATRYFDFRLFVNEHNHVMIKNESNEYTLFSFYEILDFFDKMGDVVVNVTFEASLNDFMRDSYTGKEKKFKEVCNIIDRIYKSILFCGGTRKFDKTTIYTFRKRPTNYNIEVISPAEWSPMYKFISRWCTFLIGRLNRMYIEKFKGQSGFLVLNYVNRR